MENVNIIGAGLAGVSAAITLAENNIQSNLISLQPSERAQSVLAEGGINGALNTMGEEDAPKYHMEDTMRAGAYLADEEAIRGLTDEAPQIIRDLEGLGVAFNTQKEEILLRNFGGQKKKRTAYARSSTGKIIMTALIDEARKYEAQGLITRYPHHAFESLVLSDKTADRVCRGALVRNTYTTRLRFFEGPVILAIGGMNGVFPELTTGTTANSGDALAQIFAQGVRLGNLEMIQYHPTTIGISGKRCLVTEAARGEGGRLFVLREGKPWYFMEEKYPELKNLMPRDVVSREIYFVKKDPVCGDQVYLDMTGLSREVWEKRLPDLRAELRHYLSMDPLTTPIPVEPGIHYFMGGIDVDRKHQTNIAKLYAAGECCDQYHGANRLGGNSMLGAIYGGRVAARTVTEVVMAQKAQSKVRTAAETIGGSIIENAVETVGDSIIGIAAEPPGGGNIENASERLGRDADVHGGNAKKINYEEIPETDRDFREASKQVIYEIRDILASAMGIVRNAQGLRKAEEELTRLLYRDGLNERERNRIYLAQAIVASAISRKESRGAHYREDYPEMDEAFWGIMLAELKRDADIPIQITCRKAQQAEEAR
ncbi:MAG: FAD-binding protein [Lachnospiraceae bacterium]|nr:FAD-binding protein [Lachnospiraceae bacterium]